MGRALVTRETNLLQLQVEGFQGKAMTTIIDKANTYVVVDDLTDAQVQAVVDKHKPDPLFGLSPRQKRARVLTDKVKGGQNLNPAEQAEAIGLILIAVTEGRL